MSKLELKELIIIMILSLINIIIAFKITNLLGITNIIIIRTFSVMYGNITWEVVIFLGLLFIESIFLHNYNKNHQISY